MIPAVLLALWVPLLPVTALPVQDRRGPLRSPAPLDWEMFPVFKQLLLPDADTCRRLLHSAPASGLGPEYLSRLAMERALKEIGCPEEAPGLQRQPVRMAERDVVEGGADSAEVRWQGSRVDPVVSPGASGRARRSVTVPEQCKSAYSWAVYEMAMLVVEYANKLPSTDLVTELNTTAVQVTQECTPESWGRLEEVAKRLMGSPEIHTYSLSVEDQFYFLKSVVGIYVRLLVDFIAKEVGRDFSQGGSPASVSG